MKIAMLMAAAVVGASPALAQQAPDKFCEGLAAAVKAAGDTPAFASMPAEGAGKARPAGMEGAHSCDVLKGSPGNADKLVCAWALGDAGVATMTLPVRVKACAAVRDWTAGKIDVGEKRVEAVRLIKPGSTVEVVALATPGNSRTESLTVFAPRK